MKYKRRIVYLSDSEWDALGRIARRRKATISSTIRDMLYEPMRGEDMADKVLHHIDGDPFNNDPSNLALRDA